MVSRNVNPTPRKGVGKNAFSFDATNLWPANRVLHQLTSPKSFHRRTSRPARWAWVGGRLGARRAPCAVLFCSATLSKNRQFAVYQPPLPTLQIAGPLINCICTFFPWRLPAAPSTWLGSFPLGKLIAVLHCLQFFFAIIPMRGFKLVPS